MKSIMVLCLAALLAAPSALQAAEAPHENINLSIPESSSSSSR